MIRKKSVSTSDFSSLRRDLLATRAGKRRKIRISTDRAILTETANVVSFDLALRLELFELLIRKCADKNLKRELLNQCKEIKKEANFSHALNLFLLRGCY